MKNISAKHFVFFVCFISCSSFCAEYSKESVKEQNYNANSAVPALRTPPPIRGRAKITLSPELMELAQKYPLVVNCEMIEGTHQHHIKKLQKEPCGCSAFYRCFGYERD